MNYRHIYHAGNFADVFKHVLMIIALQYLQQKDKGLLALDAFAGLGLYPLHSEKAQKTREYEAGIERFMQAALTQPDLLLYKESIAEYYGQQHYPGSPLLLAHMLRPQDRLVANELHPDDYEILKSTMATHDRVRVTQRDAYESLRAELPPTERRGLILIDPPFERKDEFEVLARQMMQWHKRFSTGCYMIWYPIKSSLPVADYYAALKDGPFQAITVFEHHIKKPANPDGLTGCGIVVFNTPYGMVERFNALSAEFETALDARLRCQILKPS